MVSSKIENKYKEIELNVSAVKNKSFDIVVNEYLDKVNLFKRHINKIIISVNELNDLLLELSDNNKLSLYTAKDDFIKLIHILQSGADDIKKSVFYKGLKSVFNDLILSISNLKEIIEDVIFFFDAKKDKEFENLFSDIANS